MPGEELDIGEIVVSVPGDGDETVDLRGADLDQVLRWIVEQLMAENAWNHLSASKQLGLPNRTLKDWLEGKTKSTAIHTLSTICVALKSTPVALFRRHPRYQPETAEAQRFAEDAAYDRLRSVFSVAQARRLSRIGEVLKDRGLLEKAIALFEGMLGIQEAPSAPAEATAGPARRRRARS